MNSLHTNLMEIDTFKLNYLLSQNCILIFSSLDVLIHSNIKAMNDPLKGKKNKVFEWSLSWILYM